MDEDDELASAKARWDLIRHATDEQILVWVRMQREHQRTPQLNIDWVKTILLAACGALIIVSLFEWHTGMMTNGNAGLVIGGAVVVMGIQLKRKH